MKLKLFLLGILIALSLDEVRSYLLSFPIRHDNLLRFKTRALNENLVDFVNIYKESKTFFDAQYQALSDSSRSEMNEMSRNFNARALSRIGFVSQEIKDSQFELSNEIQNRAIEINDEPECIIQARNDLDRAVNDAGVAIRMTAESLSEDLLTLNEIAVYEVIELTELMNSLLQIEMLLVFGDNNAVTNMFFLLLTMESDIRAFGALFEYFVSEIYVEMVIWTMLTDEMTAQSFSQLEVSAAEFQTNATSIRNSLATCA